MLPGGGELAFLPAFCLGARARRSVPMPTWWLPRRCHHACCATFTRARVASWCVTHVGIRAHCHCSPSGVVRRVRAVSVVRLLLQKGADPRLEGPNGMSAAGMARIEGWENAALIGEYLPVFESAPGPVPAFGWGDA